MTRFWTGKQMRMSGYTHGNPYQGSNSYRKIISGRPPIVFSAVGRNSKGKTLYGQQFYNKKLNSYTS